jgi:AcrR family transcriptional regulator
MSPAYIRRNPPFSKGRRIVSVETPLPERRPRADARRNRERLVDTARTAFADIGPEVTLDEIARRAGFGIGTLYRHFPTRDAIVEAVYRHEVEQLSLAASRLLETLPPAEALHAWMRLFVDYIARKKVMASALSALGGGTTELFASSGERITEAIKLLVDRAAAAGEIRAGVDPLDLLLALVGISYGRSGSGWQASALRLIDILMDGLRRQPAADR